MAMRNREDDGMITKVVSINRVSKTVKGGRIMKFAALVVVGDGKGTIGYGIGKSGEVPEAIRKGEAAAKKNMHKVAVKGTTIPHEIVGKYGAGAVLLANVFPHTLDNTVAGLHIFLCSRSCSFRKLKYRHSMLQSPNLWFLYT